MIQIAIEDAEFLNEASFTERLQIRYEMDYWTVLYCL